jgi:hypothetical protein
MEKQPNDGRVRFLSDEQVRSLSAEERLNYIYNNKIEGLDTVSKDEVLETLKLIDECIEIGFIAGRMPEGYVNSALSYFEQAPDVFPFVSKDSYDVDSIVKYLERVTKHIRTHSEIFYGVLKKNAKYSKQDRVQACEGDHDWATPFTEPAACECGRREGSIGIEERVNKFYDFIQKFRKS